MGLALAALAAFSINASAQTAVRSNQCADKQAKNCPAARPGNAQCDKGRNVFGFDFTTLTLSDDQKAKVEALENATRQSMREQREQQKLEADSARAARKGCGREIRTKYLKDLRTILTESQYVEVLEQNFINGQRDKKGGPAKFGVRHDRGKLQKADMRHGGKMKKMEKK